MGSRSGLGLPTLAYIASSNRVNTWVHYTKADGLSSNHVSWITTQGNDVWFASKEDGVSRFDKVTGEWTIYKQADFLADNDIRAITRDAEGNLWMATVAGISVYSPQTRSWEIIAKEDGLPTPYVTSIHIPKETISRQPSARRDWVTQPVQETSHQSETSSAENREPRTESHSSVWIGSDRGLGTQKYVGDEWTFYTPPQVEAHSEAFVTAIDTDTAQPNPVIWIGTSSGPAMYDPTSEKWSQLAVPDAPKNPLILSVLVRDDSVWFGGVEGVWAILDCG